MKTKVKYKILEINKNRSIFKEDEIIVEKPYTIFVNDKEIVTLLCTPKSIKYLTVGYIFVEELIKKKSDILAINILEEKGLIYVSLKEFSYKLYSKKTITSSCGKGTIFYNELDSFNSKINTSNIIINNSKVSRVMKKFTTQSQLFKETGGVHSCGLCIDDRIIVFEEDIGRHNAIDKIIGYIILNDLEVKDKYIVTSGRLSSDMVIKAAKINIPAVVSKSAPTNLSIEIAKSLNLTLIGFARGNKMNVYTQSGNILIDRKFKLNKDT
ncbi:formate dehydrogenase accessory sulfurtransferase FdhD [Clostridiaceae bacterium M8S5]|nr:formate dehydrogenase accessory sulfurtransferase FdhD [Clostridiaceae bacterium M8S5]